MASASRPENPHVNRQVIGALLRQVPWEFEFFQTMRLLHRLTPNRRQVGLFSIPSREVARFRAHPSVTFPASQVQGLEWNEDQPIEITVNFMGLFGPMGALPLYYTEYIMQELREWQRRNKDASREDGRRMPPLPAFLDLFNHRMISLFYRAWEKYRFYVPYERGERDRLSQYLLDFIGLGTPGLQGRFGPRDQREPRDVRDDTLIFYSGLLALMPRSALALEQLLSDYFEVPVQVEQFMGAWFPLEVHSQCQFQRGDSYSEQLGVGVVVGDEVWDPQSGIRVRVGPLTLQQYLDFLPNGAGYKPLHALTRFFSNSELNFELQLVLRHDEVPACELGAGGEAGPRLGWITWMRNQDMDRNPDETVLRM